MINFIYLMTNSIKTRNYIMYICIYSFVTFWIYNQPCESRILSCEPAENNEQHSIAFNLTSYDNSNILVNSRNGPIWDCRYDVTCHNPYKDRYSVSVSYFEKFAILNITIYNVSRETSPENGNAWFNVQFGIETLQEPCVLRLFSRPKDVICKNTLSNDGLHLICKTEKLYHPAKCYFLVLFNKSLVETRLYQISTSHERLVGSEDEFTSNCSLFVPKTSLNLGLYDVTVIVSPNVTNSETDIKYGTNVTQSIRLERPKVYFVNCTESSKEHTEVSCHCKVETLHPVDVSVAWYDANGKTHCNGSSPQVIRFLVKRMLPDYYCQAINTFGWMSEKLFYNLTVLISLTINNLTVNGDDLSTTIERNSSVMIHCQAEGNPIKELRLYNGPSLIGQSIRKIEVNYSMLCDSFTAVMCLVVQEMTQISRNITVYMKCPLQLTYATKLPSVIQLTPYNRSIVLHVFGYPKPLNYILLKNGSTMINFKNVTGGLAMEDNYKIEYHEDVSPYGRVNLSFLNLLHKERTDYIFIIDNGNSPMLHCRFTIKTGLEIVLFEDENSFTVWLIGVGAVTMFLLAIVAGTCCYCKRKVSKHVKENKYNSPSMLHDEVIYEIIDQNDETENNVIIVENADHVKVPDPHNEGMNYSIIEESMDVNVSQRISDGNTVTITNNKYDTLDKELFGDHDNYTRVYKKNYDWDSDYITVIDEETTGEDDYITVIDKIKLFNNKYIAVVKENSSDDKEYITLLDDPYGETRSYPVNKVPLGKSTDDVVCEHNHQLLREANQSREVTGRGVLAEGDHPRRLAVCDHIALDGGALWRALKEFKLYGSLTSFAIAH